MLAFVGVSNFMQEKIQLIRPKEEYEMKKKWRDGYKKWERRNKRMKCEMNEWDDIECWKSEEREKNLNFKCSHTLESEKEIKNWSNMLHVNFSFKVG
jgi:hypothetical protein